MKVSLSRPESRKIKSTLTSKKNSHTNSLIYKQINSQMEQLFSKSKYLNHQVINKEKPQPKEDKPDKPNKKNSYINKKKKSQKITLSSSQDASKLILQKLHNNFMAGMNSPVSGSQNSDNQQQDDVQIMQLKKNMGIKSSLPTSSPSMLKSTNSTVQSRPRSQKQSQNSTPFQSASITPSGTLSKKSYTKTKIKLQTKILSNFKLERKLFCYDYIIGKGGFGKVWRVEHIKTRNCYAMKEMLKSIVITKKSVQSVMNERVLLSQLNSPFLVNMHYAFQDRDTLYLVLDLMEGGDLRYHIGNKVFSQIQSKFFVACIILGLEHMHRSNIIHRDIKPQNLVLDSRGYIRITDLGIARTYRPNNSSDTSGTPGYMSPQVICRQNHSFVSDFFALGVIAYELMTGKRPYNGRTRNQIRQNMLAKQAQIKPSDVPDTWSFQAADFINRLIQRKPQNRLGFHGIQQIKNHPWIRTINWERLYSKQIQSPFIPFMKKKNFDQDEQITIEDEEEAAMIEKNSLLLRKPQFQQLFKDYFYDENQNLQTAKETKKITSNSSMVTPAWICLQPQNSSKNKLSTQKQKEKEKQKQKTSIAQKLASKKYSQQLYLKRTANVTTMQSQQRDSTMRNKKNNDFYEINTGKALIHDTNDPYMVKDCQVIQSLNTSQVIDVQYLASLKQRRKNSQPSQKQASKTFFKDVRN